MIPTGWFFVQHHAASKSVSVSRSDGERTSGLCRGDADEMDPGRDPQHFERGHPYKSYIQADVAIRVDATTRCSWTFGLAFLVKVGILIGR